MLGEPGGGTARACHQGLESATVFPIVALESAMSFFPSKNGASDDRAQGCRGADDLLFEFPARRTFSSRLTAIAPIGFLFFLFFP